MFGHQIAKIMSGSSIHANIRDQIFRSFTPRELIKCLRVNKEWRSVISTYLPFPRIFEEIVNLPHIKNTLAIIGNQNITYLELNRRVNLLAHHLLQCFPHNSDHREILIGLYFDHSPEAIMAILAIMKAGFAYVPLSSDTRRIPTQRILNYLEDCKPDIILTHSDYSQHELLASPLAQKHIFLDKLFPQLTNPTHEVNPNILIKPDQLAYVIYSSGSIAKPKGIAIEYQGLYNAMASHHVALNITAKDIIAQFASLSFDASLMEIMAALGRGAALCIVPQNILTNTQALGKFYRDNKVTIAIFTPSMLKELDSNSFECLDAIICAGEKIDEATIRKWSQQNNGKQRMIINGYGPAEATICATLAICSPDTKITIGKAIRGIEIFLLQKDLTQKEKNQLLKGEKRLEDYIISDDSEGEIYLSGPGLARGYFGNSERAKNLTQERFLNIRRANGNLVRAYQTRDRAKFVDGHLILTGRLDRQVKIYGQLVNPEEIEETIKEFDNQLMGVYVDPIIDENGHPLFTGYLIEPTKQYNINLINLMAYLKDKLPAYMLPSRWFITHELPLNSNNKFDPKLLPKSLSCKHAQSLPRIELSGIYENEIAICFEFILKIQHERTILVNGQREIIPANANFKYSAEDNFFYLGGTSILANQLAIKIQEKYPDIKLSPTDIFCYPTIASLTRRIRKLKSEIPTSIEKITLKNATASSTATPIVLIHTLLGNPNVDYDKLINNWQIEHPVYTIKSNGLANPKDMATTLEEIAADYVNDLQTICPSGPYILVGWSAGGIIAYEMARQLEAKKQNVAIIAIDTEFVTHLQNMSKSKYADWIYEFAMFYCNYRRLGAFPLTQDLLHPLEKDQQILIVFDYCLQTLPNANQNELCSIKILLLAELSYQFRPLKNSNISLIAAQNTINNAGDERIGWPVSLTLHQYQALNTTHHNILSHDLNKTETHLTHFCKVEDALFKLELFRQLLFTYYTNKENSYIHRLLAEDTLIEKSFINLSIVKEVTQRSSEARLKNARAQTEIISSYEDIYSTYAKEPILIADLFKSRDGKEPRELHITGRAGIGKSTLCQYLAYLRARGILWPSKFKFIIWIKLRRLNHPYYKNKSFLTLEDILKRECLEQLDLDQINNIEKYLNTIAPQVLFLLDGYDELNPNSPCGPIIQTLLNHTNFRIIVTSRPYYFVNHNFDLYLENIGFTNDNIENYIKDFFGNQIELAKQVLCFLQKNFAIHGLAHIPIILELICSVWDKDLESLLTSEINTSTMTMTTLYRRMVEKLWLRYLRKKSNTNEHDRRIAAEQKMEQGARAFFEKIAFEGLATDTILLDHDFIKSKAREAFNLDIDENIEPILDYILQPGFLNTSDQHKNDADKDYYFIHRTLQEFLAARFWCKEFLNSNTKKSAEDFFQDHKYDPCYEIVWWFSSGLLSKEYKAHSPKSLKSFFFLLVEGGHKDQLGVYELSLYLRCLDEAGYSPELPHRDLILAVIEKYIQQLIFCDDTGNNDDTYNKLKKHEKLLSMFHLSSSVISSPRIRKTLLELLRTHNEKLQVKTIKIINLLHLYSTEVLVIFDGFCSNDNTPLTIKYNAAIGLVHTNVTNKILTQKFLLALFDDIINDRKNSVEDPIFSRWQLFEMLIPFIMDQLLLANFAALKSRLLSNQKITAERTASILRELAPNFPTAYLPDIIDTLLSSLTKVPHCTSDRCDLLYKLAKRMDIAYLSNLAPKLLKDLQVIDSHATDSYAARLLTKLIPEISGEAIIACINVSASDAENRDIFLTLLFNIFSKLSLATRTKLSSKINELASDKTILSLFLSSNNFNEIIKYIDDERVKTFIALLEKMLAEDSEDLQYTAALSLIVIISKLPPHLAKKVINVLNRMQKDDRNRSYWQRSAVIALCAVPKTFDPNLGIESLTILIDILEDDKKDVLQKLYTLKILLDIINNYNLILSNYDITTIVKTLFIYQDSEQKNLAAAIIIALLNKNDTNINNHIFDLIIEVFCYIYDGQLQCANQIDLIFEQSPNNQEFKQCVPYNLLLEFIEKLIEQISDGDARHKYSAILIIKDLARFCNLSLYFRATKALINCLDYNDAKVRDHACKCLQYRFNKLNYEAVTLLFKKLHSLLLLPTTPSKDREQLLSLMCSYFIKESTAVCVHIAPNRQSLRFYSGRNVCELPIKAYEEGNACLSYLKTMFHDLINAPIATSTDNHSNEASKNPQGGDEDPELAAAIAMSLEPNLQVANNANPTPPHRNSSQNTYLKPALAISITATLASLWLLKKNSPVITQITQTVTEKVNKVVKQNCTIS